MSESEKKAVADLAESLRLSGREDAAWMIANSAMTIEEDGHYIKKIDGMYEDLLQRANDRESIIKVLADNGLATGGELHSWRCEHPQVYGECTCVAELADDLIAYLTSPSERTNLCPTNKQSA